MLVLRNGELPVDTDTRSLLTLVAPAELPDPGERHFLGLDDDGTAVFMVRGDAPTLALADEITWAGLRELGTALTLDALDVAGKPS